LAKMLSPGSILSLRKRKSSAVRAAAAFALAQVPSARVSEVLTPYVDDRDPRVRQIARSQVEG
jgi:HEAT repeat protein